MKYLAEKFKNKTVCWFDMETEHLGLRNNHPWQTACILTKDKQVVDSLDLLIKWPQGINVSQGAAIATRYNPRTVEMLGVAPEVAYKEMLARFQAADIIAGHNVLGFDVYIWQVLCAKMGVKPYNIVPKIVDTACVAKGIKYDMLPRSGEPFINWQYKLAHTWRRGVKYSLKHLGHEFGIEHDYDNLHNALIDLQLNIKVFDKLGYMLPIPYDENY